MFPYPLTWSASKKRGIPFTVALQGSPGHRMGNGSQTSKPSTWLAIAAYDCMTGWRYARRSVRFISKPGSQIGFDRLNQSDHRKGGARKIGFGASKTTWTPLSTSGRKRATASSTAAARSWVASASDMAFLAYSSGKFAHWSPKRASLRDGRNKTSPRRASRSISVAIALVNSWHVAEVSRSVRHRLRYEQPWLRERS